MLTKTLAIFGISAAIVAAMFVWGKMIEGKGGSGASTETKGDKDESSVST